MNPLALLKTYWQIAATAAAVSVLVGSCVLRDRSIEQKGAAKATAKIEKATTDATSKGAAAARQSRIGGVHGQRDPYTRND